MKLKIKQSIKNKVVTIELETIDFTEEENLMLDQLGEPTVNFEKVYGKNPVRIEKKIRSGFKVRQKFDAHDEGMEKTADNITSFLEDIEECLGNVMSKLQDEYIVNIIPGEKVETIDY